MLKSSQIRRAASSPWGPIHFEGINWRGNGAVPFGVRNRSRFVVGYWISCAFFFFLPFYAVERKVFPQRLEKWKKEKEESQ